MRYRQQMFACVTIHWWYMNMQIISTTHVYSWYISHHNGWIILFLLTLNCIYHSAHTLLVCHASVLKRYLYDAWQVHFMCILSTYAAVGGPVDIFVFVFFFFFSLCLFFVGYGFYCFVFYFSEIFCFGVSCTRVRQQVHIDCWMNHGAICFIFAGAMACLLYIIYLSPTFSLCLYTSALFWVHLSCTWLYWKFFFNKSASI